MGRTPGGVRGLKQSVEDDYNLFCVSHPGRGAWIETVVILNDGIRVVGRTPGGVRGLKHVLNDALLKYTSRTPPGVRGLKPFSSSSRNRLFRRTPPGVRGLKLCIVYRKIINRMSHPARGAWIETSKSHQVCQ